MNATAIWCMVWSALALAGVGKQLGPVPLRKRHYRRGAAAASSRDWLLVRGGQAGDELDAERERLYDAYNQLHVLARRYNKAFDAPAIVVVGAQSSGKSALIEALMGFQFNEVGGGTRTRRPIALRMHYNPDCDEPRCYVRDERFEGGLATGDGERSATLSEVRAFVESENRRLERDAHRSFENREIVVRVEYRHCPNLVLVDTPGLIAAAPSLGVATEDEGVEQRKWRRAATEAYELALSRCKPREHILLCIEDTADWKLDSIARRLCQQADPTLSRTIVVNTKLDTKLVQFAQRKDVANFLRAKPLVRLHPHLLAGPFFTSVPAGRVGQSPTVPNLPTKRSTFFWDSDDDDTDDDFAAYDSDAAFRAAVDRAASADASLVASRIGAEAYGDVALKLGVASLRTFLEARVERTYRVNVARVLPLLRAERAKVSSALKRVSEELDGLTPQRLRRSADAVADKFCRALAAAVAGAVSAPPSDFGETLADERVHGGAFLAPDDLLEGDVLAEDDFSADQHFEYDEDEEEETGGRRRRRMARGGFSPAAAKRGNKKKNKAVSSMELTLSQADLDQSVGHASASLYGGAQYRRAMREFAVAVRHLSLPELDTDEIANALGVGDVHDGADLVRAACVIAVDKARRSFEPQLETLAVRVSHVMRRLPPVLEYIIDKQDASDDKQRLDDSGRANFFRLVSRIYDTYVAELAETANGRCKDDLQAMTRFVTWDLASQGGDATHALKTALSPMPALAGADDDNVDHVLVGDLDDEPVNLGVGADGALGEDEETVVREWKRLARSTDDEQQPEPTSAEIVEALATDSAHEIFGSAESSLNSKKMVAVLVKRIASAWREHFARTVAVKFNCFFLVPFVDRFPLTLRESLDDVFDNNSDLFDVSNARKALEARRDLLQQELDANNKLHNTFDAIQRACTHDFSRDEPERSQDPRR